MTDGGERGEAPDEGRTDPAEDGPPLNFGDIDEKIQDGGRHTERRGPKKPALNTGWQLSGKRGVRLAGPGGGTQRGEEESQHQGGAAERPHDAAQLQGMKQGMFHQFRAG